ncbi:C40 family peptidase [Lentiprolixibacter aurantiacus]|uniref:NlpC/P60 family protein n=1 Tax=Lentiprolixibacter aurantiacus TaxID=2993939 RepID=A0AAE3MM71_9FLAO|nr:NlpC/P60 family protein [Lentiprolixibacter aurantiacus]MCX2719931.1 NlpC/P60 family protein [Lentiprolixibacter aurantiacus]
MPYGICPLSLIAVRSTADDSSRMITQLLYGDSFKILESRRHWSKIRISEEKSEGYIKNDQFIALGDADYEALSEVKNSNHALDLVSFVKTGQGILIPILLGSNISNAAIMSHDFEGSASKAAVDKDNLISTALLYLNAPEQDGGKSPFGIDNSGFTLMVYRINGVQLMRSAEEQAAQGEPLSFIEESEAGDLAFFDDRDGNINHVGIIMPDNYIIHVDGKVRIDRLDHTGIFNREKRNYTHQLRVIKKII